MSRLLNNDPATPMRLVIVVPEYTIFSPIRDQLKNLVERDGVDVEVWSLESINWARSPDRPAILIGTQSQFISGLLNRSTSVDRELYPLVAGLLANDSFVLCLNTSLYGWGGKTLAEIEGLIQGQVYRHHLVWHFESIPTYETVHNRLATRNHPVGETELPEFTTSDTALYLDFYNQSYIVDAAPMCLGGELEAYIDSLCTFIQSQHQQDKQTLVVLNHVSRAQALFAEYRARYPETPVFLYHGSFRGRERTQRQHEIMEEYVDGGVLIADQAIESNHWLCDPQIIISELCPWASFRCRIQQRGQPQPVQVHWIEIGDEMPTRKRPGARESQLNPYRPYERADIEYTRQQLMALGRNTSNYQLLHINEPPIFKEGLLPTQQALNFLLDTTPIADQEIDISLYLSPDQNLDCYVVWRDLDDEASFRHEIPTLTETCAVHKFVLRQFLRQTSNSRCFRYQPAGWVPVAPDNIRAGDILLLDIKSGGYSLDMGFTSIVRDAPTVLLTEEGAPPPTFRRTRIIEEPIYIATIAQWVQIGLERLTELIDRLGLELPEAELKTAVKFMLSGRGTQEFQRLLKVPYQEDPLANHEEAIAFLPDLDPTRRGYRYEVASLLVGIRSGINALEAYLILSHLGRLRCQIDPTESDCEATAQTGLVQCHGVRRGDRVQLYEVGGQIVGGVEIDPSMVLPGGDLSWQNIMDSLLEVIRPHQLLFLEALIRSIFLRVGLELRM